MYELRDLRGVQPTEAMDVLLDARATRQTAEVQEAIAILHIVENYHRDLPENPMPGRGRLVELAADGGPQLNEFVPLELSAALGVSQQSITLLISDLLDLEYRHPLLWQQVRQGSVPLWHARKVAARVSSVDLGLQAALELDRQLTPTLPGITVGRSLKLLEGLIVALDPRAAEQRAETQRRSRWIRIQPQPDGVSWLDGKLNNADGKQLDGALNRIAAILKTTGDTDDREARRSSAIGILANPALALALLQQEGQLPTVSAERSPAANSRGSVGTGDVGAGCAGAEGARCTVCAGAEGAGCEVCAGGEGEVCVGARNTSTGEAGSDASTRATQLERLLAQLGPLLATIDPKRLQPKSTLYVHISDRTVCKKRGVARVEGIGPIPVKQLRHLLKGTRVQIQPVFDPGGVTPVDSYEIPRPMRRAMILRQPVDTFPYGSGTSRGLDLDHTIPYRTDGSPGQTRLDNLGPLTRRPHRAKTHDKWQVLQPIAGCYLWRSPLGLTYWRTADGRTLPLGWTPDLSTPTTTTTPTTTSSRPAHDPPPD